MDKKARGYGHTAAAHPAIPSQPPAQQIHHAGEPRAAHFSGNADSIAVAIRRVVAGGEKRAGHELIYNGFEQMETLFVERLLRPAMTVVDVGAHHGLYTLLVSKRVGRKGRVIAFEPSPREFRKLKKHIRWNRCSNVQLMPCAVGDEPGETDFYLVEGSQDWSNSLRPPAVDEPTSRVRIAVRRLDDALEELDV